jgi:hypothetical protein
LAKAVAVWLTPSIAIATATAISIADGAAARE